VSKHGINWREWWEKSFRLIDLRSELLAWAQERYGGATSMEVLKRPSVMSGEEHVRKLLALFERDKDWKVTPGAVEKLIDLLLVREQELAVPRPPRGTMGYYFWNPDASATKARAALYEALPELLHCWATRPPKEP